MESPERELPALINALLQSPPRQQRALVERHYTPDCRLTHALVVSENRAEIIRVFQFWRTVNRRCTAHIHEIVMDASGSKVWVQFTQRIEGLVCFDLAMSTLLYLAPTPRGTWVITKQVDYHSFESVLYTAPYLGWLMEHGFRRLSTWMIIGGASAAAMAWPTADRLLRRAPLVGGARWERLKAAAAGRWYMGKEQYRGRELAPYDARK